MKLTAYELPRSYWRDKAEEAGINLKTFQARIARGWSPHRAATEPPRKGSGWRYSHDAAVSRAHGLYWESVRKWRRRHCDKDTPAEEIAQRPVARRERVTVSDRARAAGIDPRTVFDRLRRGWSEDRALSVPPQAPGSTIMQNRKRTKE